MSDKKRPFLNRKAVVSAVLATMTTLPVAAHTSTPMEVGSNIELNIQSELVKNNLADLILEPSNNPQNIRMAAHSSHASHSSHGSHASHESHASHYSSSPY